MIPRNDHSIAQGAKIPIDREWYRFLRDLDRFAVPPKGIVMASLSATEVTANFDATGLGIGSYVGYAICNGSNGTPDLTDRFVRANVAGGGATGGADSSAHTHAIDHDHGSFTSGDESSHTHDAGSLFADINIDVSGSQIVQNYSPHAFTSNVHIDGTLPAAGAGSPANATVVSGTSAAGSAHSHAVDVPSLTDTSGAASATENRPSYYELVPLMRLGVA